MRHVALLAAALMAASAACLSEGTLTYGDADWRDGGLIGATGFEKGVEHFQVPHGVERLWTNLRYSSEGQAWFRVEDPRGSQMGQHATLEYTQKDLEPWFEISQPLGGVWNFRYEGRQNVTYAVGVYVE